MHCSQVATIASTQQSSVQDETAALPVETDDSKDKNPVCTYIDKINKKLKI